MFNKTEITEEYCLKFVKLPSLTLAKLMYKEIPEAWPNLEACRSTVRHVRGAHGKQGRKKRAGKKGFFRPLEIPYNPLGCLDEPLRSIDDWGVVDIEYQKALILCDVHIPYYDKVAFTEALKFGQDKGCDTVILNGDFVDFYSISKWQKDPRKRDFPGELAQCIETLDIIRDLFPDAKIILKEGNHEERYFRFLCLKAPELLGVPEYEIDKILNLDMLDVQLVKDKKPMKLGKLYVIHGHEFGQSTFSPVNFARTLFLKAKDYCLAGHAHQVSEHSTKGISGDPVVCWSVGHLGDPHPDYRPLNEWGHGFAIVTNMGGDEFRVDNKKIINGKVY